MQAMTKHWTREAETSRTLDRLSGCKVPHVPFWPGRPGMWTDEAPISSDGELGDIARDAQRDLLQAQSELLVAVETDAERVDAYLAAVEQNARAALAKVAILRQRLTGAVMPETN